MEPKAALQRQIERYRAMSGEERLKVALNLHELSCEIARDGIRQQHPAASTEEVERYLQERIALAQRL
jgi:Rv0078B-related antitoxin